MVSEFIDLTTPPNSPSIFGDGDDLPSTLLEEGREEEHEKANAWSTRRTGLRRSYRPPPIIASRSGIHGATADASWNLPTPPFECYKQTVNSPALVAEVIVANAAESGGQSLTERSETPRLSSAPLVPENDKFSQLNSFLELKDKAQSDLDLVHQEQQEDDSIEMLRDLGSHYLRHIPRSTSRFKNSQTNHSSEMSIKRTLWLNSFTATDEFSTQDDSDCLTETTAQEWEDQQADLAVLFNSSQTDGHTNFLARTRQYSQESLGLTCSQPLGSRMPSEQTVRLSRISKSTPASKLSPLSSPSVPDVLPSMILHHPRQSFSRRFGSNRRSIRRGSLATQTFTRKRPRWRYKRRRQRRDRPHDVSPHNSSSSPLIRHTRAIDILRSRRRRLRLLSLRSRVRARHKKTIDGTRSTRRQGCSRVQWSKRLAKQGKVSLHGSRPHSGEGHVTSDSMLSRRNPKRVEEKDVKQGDGLISNSTSWRKITMSDI